MISRKTALRLGEVFEEIFSYHTLGKYHSRLFKIDKGIFYDFLFENDYEPWFCNSVKSILEVSRNIKEHIAKLHTGETLAKITPSWSWEDRQRLGQQYLKDLIRDILDYYSDLKYRQEDYKAGVDGLIRSIELDGYKYQKGTLLLPESEVMDVDTERSYLQELIGKSGVANKDTILHHLSLTEEHYVDERWDDSISNSRKFFEEVVRQTAIKLHTLKTQVTLDKKIAEKAGSCINYLKKEGLLEEKEDKALGELYVLMSDKGGHPYMAKEDQARLLRNLSLTVSQFVLLRLIGFTNAE